MNEPIRTFRPDEIWVTPWVIAPWFRRVVGYKRGVGFQYRRLPRRLTRWYAKQRRKGNG